MKIERVDDTKILWSLEKEDFVQNEIKATDFLYGTQKARSLFREAMRQAERDLSFSTEGFQIQCQLQELTEEKVTFAVTRQELTPKEPLLACKFDSLEKAVRALGGIHWKLQFPNSLYKYDGEYILLLNLQKRDSEQKNWWTTVLSEFGELLLLTDAQSAFLKEHGTCIVEEGAVQKLREIA